MAGCDGYIVKPIDARALPGLVGEFIAGRREQVATAHEEADLLRAYSRKLAENYGFVACTTCGG